MNKIDAMACYSLMESLMDKYYFAAGRQNDIATIASSMALSEKDNCTIDPAYWQDWLWAIDGKKSKTVLRESPAGDGGVITWWDIIKGEREKSLPNKKLTLQEGYETAIRFLNKYADLLDSKAIREFIAQFTFDKRTEAASKIEQSK